MEERRRAQRLRTYLGGEIAFHHRCSRLECLVRNLSSNGAKLSFPRPAVIPEFFDLTIPQNLDHRHVRLIWCSEMEAGVSFEETEAEPVISFKAARRIKHLEAERDALARRLAELTDRA